MNTGGVCVCVRDCAVISIVLWTLVETCRYMKDEQLGRKILNVFEAVWILHYVSNG